MLAGVLSRYSPVFSLDTRRRSACCRHRVVATMADVDTGEDGRLNAGDVAKYSMQVSNPGNTCLMDIAVRDEDGGEISCDESYKGQKRPCIAQVPPTR